MADAEAKTQKQYLARIRPTSKRETHIIGGRVFRRAKGWYGPITDLAFVERLQEEPENDLNPMSSERVFEVVTRDESVDIEERERRIEDPAGTATKPIEVPPAPVRETPRKVSRPLASE